MRSCQYTVCQPCGQRLRHSSHHFQRTLVDRWSCRPHHIQQLTLRLAANVLRLAYRTGSVPMQKIGVSATRSMAQFINQNPQRSCALLDGPSLEVWTVFRGPSYSALHLCSLALRPKWPSAALMACLALEVAAQLSRQAPPGVVAPVLQYLQFMRRVLAVPVQP